MGKEVTGTRNRIIQLLRKRTHTVEDLARDLGITENAIRAQIALLLREGLVEPAGEVKGSRKPALMYGPTREVDSYFSKAYPPVLVNLVDVLADEMSPEEFYDVMKKLGHRLAASRPRPARDLRERIDDAAAFYQALGGMAEIEEEGKKLIIKGYGCPLAEAVASHAGICVAMESLMSELIGVPVRQKCDRGETPSCRFEVGSE
ncbi:MAG: ArsR family transcriptional regulator [Syntrophorhabdales bacterium]